MFRPISIRFLYLKVTTNQLYHLRLFLHVCIMYVYICIKFSFYCDFVDPIMNMLGIVRNIFPLLVRKLLRPVAFKIDNEIN